MGKNVKIKYSSLLIFAIFMVNSFFLYNPSTVRALPNNKDANCSDPIIHITIVEAYYDDLDSDQVADDVFTKVYLDLLCSNRFQFDYYVYLTLPSGNTVYDAYSINTRLSHLTLETSFFNYATEAGDYRIDVYVLLMNGGPALSTQYLIFDPPGGAGGVGTMSTLIY